MNIWMQTVEYENILVFENAQCWRSLRFCRSLYNTGILRIHQINKLIANAYCAFFTLLFGLAIACFSDSLRWSLLKGEIVENHRPSEIWAFDCLGRYQPRCSSTLIFCCPTSMQLLCGDIKVKHGSVNTLQRHSETSVKQLLLNKVEPCHSC